jgi:pimeloyl-ACP methyl ester carboxylesterase
VLLHPLGGSIVVWEPVVELLAAERDVIAVHLPGFGASPPLAKGVNPTPQGLASGVGGFLDRLGLEDAHLVGNSLGAWVGVELARAGRARSVTGQAPAGFWSLPVGAARWHRAPHLGPGLATAAPASLAQRSRPPAGPRSQRGTSRPGAS